MYYCPAIRDTFRDMLLSMCKHRGMRATRLTGSRISWWSFGLLLTDALCSACINDNIWLGGQCFFSSLTRCVPHPPHCGAHSLSDTLASWPPCLSLHSSGKEHPGGFSLPGCPNNKVRSTPALLCFWQNLTSLGTDLYGSIWATGQMLCFDSPLACSPECLESHSR